MVLISEWLPNPKGSDTKTEWIELKNPGNSPVDLTNWRLTADGKKFFVLDGTIGSGAHIVLSRSETKITLRNSDGRLALYDAEGRLADQAHFLGTAPEGESANRSGDGFFFGAPTPGAPNVRVSAVALAHDHIHPLGVAIGPPMAVHARFAGYMLGTSLALAAAVVFILRSYEDLSHLFFHGDQSPRGSDS